MYIDEKLTSADPTSKWISDFVHSDNPKFAGKSKKERIRMALGASYAAKGKGRNEEVESVDEVSMGLLTRYKQKAGEQASAMNKAVSDVASSSAAPEHKKVAIDALVQKGNKRFSGIVRATNKQFAKEEVEELDEISKKTLGSYVSKASVDMANRSAEGERKRTMAGADYAHNISRGMDHKTAEAGMKKDREDAKPDVKKAVQRMRGIDKAVGRLTKEEAEQVEEGIYKPEVEKAFPASGVKTGASAPKGTSTMPKDKEKAKGQPAGALRKEEVEEIEELSKGTLASYAKKATRDARIKMATGKDFERIATSSRKPAYKAAATEWERRYKGDARRREAGVEKAIDRLAKEEAELEEKKRGLWDNIHAKRKRGERPARPGEKGYPKTLNVEDTELEEAGRMQGGGKDPCWKGYKMIGTKKKGGREVPNCVPTSEGKELKTFRQLKEELNGNS